MFYSIDEYFIFWGQASIGLERDLQKKKEFSMQEKNTLEKSKTSFFNVLLQKAISIHTRTKSLFYGHALRSGTHPVIKYLFSTLRNRHGLIERLLTRDRSLSRGAVTLFIVISFMYIYEKKL